MKGFKVFITLLIAFIILASMVTGCGSKAAGQEDTIQTTQAAATTQAPATEESTSAASFPVTVTDASGTEMTIEKAPEKIVSLTLGTDEMLFGLIDKQRIISVTPYALDAGVSNVADQAKEIPNAFLSKDLEKIISLQPDLVFVDTWADASFIKQLRDSKINVYVFQTPSGIDAQIKTIGEIAHVVGADEKGNEIVAWMNEKLGSVQEKLKNLKEEDKLTILDYSEQGTTSGIGTNTDDIFTRAGLINVATKAGLKEWPQINKENVIEWNPDLILLPSWYYDSKNTLDSMKKNLKDDKSLADVKAIKNDKLITVPYPHMGAISQYVALAVEDVAKAAYPELFK